MKQRIWLLAVVLATVSCASQPYVVKPRPTVHVAALSDQRRYHVHVSYLHQDDTGLTQSVDEIDAQVLTASSADSKYYKWISYRIRKYDVGSSPEDRMESQPTSTTAWHDYPPAVGFEYTMKGLAATNQGDLSNLPSMDSIPRDFDGFLFYTSVIDFHTWDIYRHEFLDSQAEGAAKLKRIGDSYTMVMPKKPIPLLEWKGLSSDFTFEGGYCRAEYLADVSEGGTTLKLISLDQNQRMRQMVYGRAGFIQLKMRYQGTSRLLGLSYWDSEDNLQRASFYEYVYSKVFVPLMAPVIMHEKRIYTIERVE